MHLPEGIQKKSSLHYLQSQATEMGGKKCQLALASMVTCDILI